MTGKLERICACGRTFVPKHKNQIHCFRSCDNERNVNCSHWSQKQRDYKYKINYGISLEEYNELFNKQNGCCAICKEHQINFKKNLHVDHNHKTGEVRGLLCHNCNLAIGRLKEDPVIIAAALEYVS